YCTIRSSLFHNHHHYNCIRIIARLQCLLVFSPRITHQHKRRTVIPGFLYVTFFGMRPKFSVQLGRHVHVN
ncbi:hypothetical protein BDN70DRAFT_443016, partial [Pholiota conissans]